MRTREWTTAMAVLGALVAGGCSEDAQPEAREGVLPAPGPIPAEAVFVAGEEPGSITIIDGGADTVVARIALGARAGDIRATPAGDTLFLALRDAPEGSGAGIGIVDVAARRLVTVLPGGSSPRALDRSPDGGRLVVSAGDSASIVDVPGASVVYATGISTGVGRGAAGVRMEPSGHRTWIIAGTDADVTVLDSRSGCILGQVSVGREPSDLRFSADGRVAYVAVAGDGAVAVVDPAARTILRTMPLPPGARPTGLALSPSGETLYVANGAAGSVSLIDTRTDSLVASVEVGGEPRRIGVPADGRKLYVTNAASNEVAVVDTDSLRVVRRIPTGAPSSAIAVTAR